MDEITTIIRALAISNASNGISVAQLNKDFKNLEGCLIPYEKYGFKTLDAMLHSMTDAIRVNGHGMTAIVHPLTNEKSQHVREMIERSKKNGKKPAYTTYHKLPSPPKGGYNTNIDQGQKTKFTHFTTSNSALKTLTSVDMEKFQKDIREEMERAERQHNALQAIQNTNRDKQQPVNGTLGGPNHPRAGIVPSNTPSNKKSVPAQKVNGKITNGMIVSAQEQKHESAKEVPDNSLAVPSGTMQVKETVVETILPVHLKPKAVVNAVVTAALNPTNFHVHLREHTDKLVTLAPHIDTLYRTKLAGDEWLVPKAAVQVGLHCAAQYHNRWYRAKVMSMLNHDRVLLLYIDYGYLRYVPLPNIRFLARELAAIPPQALQVSLVHLKPSNGTWTDACCEHFAALVHRKVLDMVIVNAKKDKTLDVILTGIVNGPVDLLIQNPDTNTVNRQLAMRSDTAWSMAE
uniref:HTH OST-type domain-containing protein n=1 Tax=Anopheles epiroticus TaxID=199890 RepID=A0A182PD00_9DIPT